MKRGTYKKNLKNSQRKFQIPKWKLFYGIFLKFYFCSHSHSLVNREKNEIVCSLCQFQSKLNSIFACHFLFVFKSTAHSRVLVKLELLSLSTVIRMEYMNNRFWLTRTSFAIKIWRKWVNTTQNAFEIIFFFIIHKWKITGKNFFFYTNTETNSFKRTRKKEKNWKSWVYCMNAFVIATTTFTSFFSFGKCEFITFLFPLWKRTTNTQSNEKKLWKILRLIIINAPEWIEGFIESNTSQ